MKTEGNRKRLDKIARAFTPDPVVVSWIVEELSQFDSLPEYAAWLTGDFARAPLPRMLRKIESSLGASLGSRRTSEDLLHRRCKETRLLFNLLVVLNCHIYELVTQHKDQLKTIIARIQMADERVRSANSQWRAWRASIDTPYPLDADTAAAVLFALKYDVTQTDEWARDIAEQQADRFAHDTTDQTVSFQAKVEGLRAGVHELCSSGLVQRGLRVNLGPSLFEFLSDIPLVEEVSIDLTAVELAECAATLDHRGFDLGVPADPHPLARMRLRQRTAILAEQKTSTAGEAEIGSARAEAAARLDTFAGRTKEIDGRPYLHLEDYRTWNKRMAGREPLRSATVSSLHRGTHG